MFKFDIQRYWVYHLIPCLGETQQILAGTSECNRALPSELVHYMFISRILMVRMHAADLSKSRITNNGKPPTHRGLCLFADDYEGNV